MLQSSICSTKTSKPSASKITTGNYCLHEAASCFYLNCVTGYQNRAHYLLLENNNNISKNNLSFPLFSLQTLLWVITVVLIEIHQSTIRILHLHFTNYYLLLWSTSLSYLYLSWHKTQSGVKHLKQIHNDKNNKAA